MLLVFKILVETLKYESKLVLEAKSKGARIVKPSTLFLYILGLLYIFSGIDLIPEKFIKPVAFGFVDDLLVIGLIIILTGSDIGGIIEYVSRKIPAIRIPEKQRIDRPVEVPISVPRNENILSVLRKSDTSISSDNIRETNVGSAIVPDAISNSIIVDDIKDDEFDDPKFFEEINAIIGKGNTGS